ncbi:MAG TPA: PP2C family protein-serine/threonine phosphatase [Candidatus Acidoferrum sp.]|jgi:serine phosphatase RsbU (regulator of sigma subunit)|nr:PP2C family protein-serine/threonine phosphatase [Candidatus Acidoferrum sp.]
MSASASPTPSVSPQAPAGGAANRVRQFWQRVSEGRQLDDLWSQFAADARASYGFYGKDVDWEEIQRLPKWHRPFHIAKDIFWAMLMKMTPARRVLLLLALAMLLMSGFTFQFGHSVQIQFKFELFAALIFLLLLSLELADKVTMKRDLEIAREIQTWLVPSQPPEVAGADIAFATRPQNSVAGDYYDAFYPDPEKREKLVVVIADVAGKSVPAALLMATLQASLRTIAGEGVPVAELVTRLNRYASAYSLDGRRFTTAVLGEYEPASRRLTYVNAGHNAPILRRENGTLEKLETGGLPLGIKVDAAYETASLELRPGDALIFFTDGVIEAFNESGEEFGNERWLRTIRGLPDWNGLQSLRYLMERVDQFVGATRQADDITCLVFRSK